MLVVVFARCVMQHFKIKCNGAEMMLCVPTSMSIMDFEKRVKEEFGLQTCKFIGLKLKKKATNLSSYNLHPVHKLLVIGSVASDVNTEEEIKIAAYEESSEQEVNYEAILQKQEAAIWCNFQQSLSSKQPFIHRITLCHEGDVDKLRRSWEPGCHSSWKMERGVFSKTKG